MTSFSSTNRLWIFNRFVLFSHIFVSWATNASCLLLLLFITNKPLLPRLETYNVAPPECQEEFSGNVQPDFMDQMPRRWMCRENPGNAIFPRLQLYYKNRCSEGEREHIKSLITDRMFDVVTADEGEMERCWKQPQPCIKVMYMSSYIEYQCQLLPLSGSN